MIWEYHYFWKHPWKIYSINLYFRCLAGDQHQSWGTQTNHFVQGSPSTPYIGGWSSPTWMMENLIINVYIKTPYETKGWWPSPIISEKWDFRPFVEIALPHLPDGKPSNSGGFSNRKNATSVVDGQIPAAAFLGSLQRPGSYKIYMSPFNIIQRRWITIIYRAPGCDVSKSPNEVT